MNTIDEAIEILKAMKEGKIAQYSNGVIWFNVPQDQLPNFCDFNYRIKPEPREWWIVLDSNGAAVSLYTTHNVDPNTLEKLKIKHKIIKVREVIE